MNKIIERIIYLILGATAGFVAGRFIMSLSLDFITNDTQGMCFEILGMVIGVLIVIIFLFYKHEKISRENGVLRNETVALITHEMRTALTSTSWAITYILKNYEMNIKDDDKKMLDGVIKSIHTTVMHTVDLLDVSLLDIGKLSISLEWIKLGKIEEMIHEVVEKYKMGTEKDGIALIADIKLDPNKEVEVDTLRLRIILENLLENSIQYTKNDIKEIAITVSNSPTTLNITVRDTGIGIPEKEQEYIFGEFYRASNARKKLSSGSGIGLHMCAQYVKAHHGTIRFESKENEGTTFYITLPLKSIADTNEFLKKI